MHTDSLGNHYASLPSRKPTPSAKSTKTDRKHGRSKREGEWVRKVKSREAAHRARGQRFTTYPC